MEISLRVMEQLSALPNVANVGIGLKERDGKLTREPCIKILVREKVDEQALRPEDVIPKEIEGYKTDVILKPEKRLAAAGSLDTRDLRPIRGGIMINNHRNPSDQGGAGTLGCLARLIVDDSLVILSNHHVLYGDSGEDGDDIGQPWIAGSCCCICNEIAKNHDKNVGLDCAIAKVNSDIGANNRIEEIGDIGLLGTSTPVMGETVRKRGVTTRLTSGTISFIDPISLEITITPNPSGGPPGDPGGRAHPTSGLDQFAFYGDSGSVVVNDNSEVIALLYAIDGATETQGFANNITRVRTALNITISPTATFPGRSPAAFAVAEPLALAAPALRQNGQLLRELEERLRQTPRGEAVADLIGTDQQEVLDLVNRHRAVKVAWHRNEGPSFVTAFARSARYPHYHLPQEINGVTLQSMLMAMGTVLEEHGSPELKKAIQAHALTVLQYADRCKSVQDLLDVLEEVPEKKQTEPMI